MPVKERLIEYLKYKGESKTAFGNNIGVSASYIQAMRKSISPDKLLRIAQTYPDLNTGWLLTGEGQMLKGGESPSLDSIHNVSVGKVIPYFDAEAAAGTGYAMNMEASRPIGMIEIGGLLKDSESALRVYGNSMTPNYPPGCVIGMRKHWDSFIEPGCVYVVETSDNRYLKRLYYNADKASFRCISDNHMLHESGPMKGELCFPEFEIPLSDVKQIFRVTGVIKRNIL